MRSFNFLTIFFSSDICLEHKTALLKEQILYTRGELERHKKKGDYDDDGNIVFFHPFCEVFRKKYKKATPLNIYF